MSYTIAAIPTLYRGRMYRSRLEARWAAFFDRLGWAYEYEPFDLGAWSPDFLLTDLNVLVEVKPITEWDQAVADKMWDAAKGREEWLLLTRVAPDFALDTDTVNLGWVFDRIEWHHALPRWLVHPSRPVLRANLPVPIYKRMREELQKLGVELGEVTFWTPDGTVGAPAAAGEAYAEYAKQLWADACNAVQWEPTP